MVLTFILRLDPIKNTIKLALNENYIEWNDELTLKNGDEIAIIPPISGG